MIPILQHSLRIAMASGTIEAEFHRWLQAVQRALRGPFIGLFAPGSFVVTTDEYAILAEELVLHDTDEATLQGDAVLVVV